LPPTTRSSTRIHIVYIVCASVVQMGWINALYDKVRTITSRPEAIGWSWFLSPFLLSSRVVWALRWDNIKHRIRVMAYSSSFMGSSSSSSSLLPSVTFC
jgi:hypothetical protein